MTCRYLKALFCTAYCSGGGKGGAGGGAVNLNADEKAVIPGEILYWDLSRRKVCHVAKVFLSEIGSRPILRLSRLSQELLGQVQVLKYVRNLREQLSDLKVVIEKSSCLIAQDLLDSVIHSRPYLVLDSEVFSIDDMTQLHDGSLIDTLTNCVEELNDHGKCGPSVFSHTHMMTYSHPTPPPPGNSVVEDCQVCKCKGCSFCQICRHADPLFPHQFWKVSCPILSSHTRAPGLSLSLSAFLTSPLCLFISSGLAVLCLLGPIP